MEHELQSPLSSLSYSTKHVPVGNINVSPRVDYLTSPLNFYSRPGNLQEETTRQNKKKSMKTAIIKVKRKSERSLVQNGEERVRLGFFGPYRKKVNDDRARSTQLRDQFPNQRYTSASPRRYLMERHGSPFHIQQNKYVEHVVPSPINLQQNNPYLDNTVSPKSPSKSEDEYAFDQVLGLNPYPPLEYSEENAHPFDRTDTIVSDLENPSTIHQPFHEFDYKSKSGRLERRGTVHSSETSMDDSESTQSMSNKRSQRRVKNINRGPAQEQEDWYGQDVSSGDASATSSDINGSSLSNLFPIICCTSQYRTKYVIDSPIASQMFRDEVENDSIDSESY